MPLDADSKPAGERNATVAEILSSLPGPVKSAQCGQRLATAAMFLQSCVIQALSRGDGPATLYALRRNASSGEHHEDLILENYTTLLSIFERLKSLWH